MDTDVEKVQPFGDARIEATILKSFSDWAKSRTQGLMEKMDIDVIESSTFCDARSEATILKSFSNRANSGTPGTHGKNGH